MSTSTYWRSDASVETGCTPAPHSAHTTQFYGDDEFLLNELCGFIATALAAGDSAVVVATKPHRESLARRLESRGLSMETIAKQGRYIALDAAETLSKFMVQNWPDERRFTEAIGSLLTQAAASSTTARIAAFGEMVALLWDEGNAEAALRLERLWNQIAASYSLSLHCAYPLSSFKRGDETELLGRICAEHSHVIPAESYTSIPDEKQRQSIISQLQLKAQALEREMAQRQQIEEELRRSKAELEFQVAQRTSALRHLSLRLLNSQDEERRRIARELHDSLGQYLVGLKLNIDMLRRAPARDDLWSEAEKLMQQCIAEIRTLSYLLHPPTIDAAGLASAARWYVEGFSERSGIKVTLQAPEDLGRFPDEIELALFRVIQEGLTNAHRHSGAHSATVLIRQNGAEVTLEIQDDGTGISKELLFSFEKTGAGAGIGLAGIRERVGELGGKMSVASDGNGTLLRVTIPYRPRVSSFSKSLN